MLAHPSSSMVVMPEVGAVAAGASLHARWSDPSVFRLSCGHCVDPAASSNGPELPVGFVPLRGGGEDRNMKNEMSSFSRIIRWAALGLHAWAYLAGHVNSVTIVSPPLPGVGKLPYTIQLPAKRLPIKS